MNENRSRNDVKTSKKNFYQKTWFKLIGILVVISIVNGTFLSPSYPVVVPKYMEEKYNEEFIYRGKLYNKTAIVSPMKNPEMMVYVRPLGNMPTQWKFRDNYYGQITSKIIEDRILKVITDLVNVDEVYLEVKSNLSITDEALERESKYSIEEIPNVIDNLPDLMIPCSVQIHVYTKDDDLNEILELLHRALKSYGGSEKIKNTYLVADTSLLEENDKIDEFYESRNLQVAKNQITDQYMKWEFFDNWGLSNKKAYEDFDYFKNAVKNIREEWAKKDKE